MSRSGTRDVGGIVRRAASRDDDAGDIAALDRSEAVNIFPSCAKTAWKAFGCSLISSIITGIGFLRFHHTDMALQAPVSAGQIRLRPHSRYLLKRPANTLLPIIASIFTADGSSGFGTPARGDCLRHGRRLHSLTLTEQRRAHQAILPAELPQRISPHPGNSVTQLPVRKAPQQVVHVPPVLPGVQPVAGDQSLPGLFHDIPGALAHLRVVHALPTYVSPLRAPKYALAECPAL